MAGILGKILAAHNPKVEGSNPSPATKICYKTRQLRRGWNTRPRFLLQNVRVLSVFCPCSQFSLTESCLPAVLQRGALAVARWLSGSLACAASHLSGPLHSLYCICLENRAGHGSADAHGIAPSRSLSLAPFRVLFIPPGAAEAICHQQAEADEYGNTEHQRGAKNDLVANALDIRHRNGKFQH